MADSVAALCKVALRRIGQSQTIDDLDEDSEQANACRDVYEHCRNVVLKAFPWSFAKKHVDLALLANITRTDWLYAYALPVDCLAPRYLANGGTRGMAPELRIPFEVHREDSTPSRRALVTDQVDAELCYTARVEEVGAFSADFDEALAWRLAAELALSLPKDRALSREMMGMYRLALSEAAAADFRASQEDLPPRNEFLRARGGTASTDLEDE